MAVLCALGLGELAGRPNDGQAWDGRKSDGREGGFLQSLIGEVRVSRTGCQIDDRQKQYSKHEGSVGVLSVRNVGKDVRT